jgi:large subunit ribosomal protein L9
MQVILTQDLDNLGAKNEVVTVKPGYARNYLIPQKIAIEASAQNLKIAEQRAKALGKKEAEMLKEIAKVKAALTAAPLDLKAKTGTSGKIFGSITTIQIARAIEEQKGYKIDRKRISLIDDIKEIGEHNVMLNLGEDEGFEIVLNITGEE